MPNFDNIQSADVRSLASIAHDAGFGIEVQDYGKSVAAHWRASGKWFYISRAYRPERDGCTGYVTLTEDGLQMKIKELKS